MRVFACLAFAALALTADAAWAQADWTRAGGALFVAPFEAAAPPAPRAFTDGQPFADLVVTAADRRGLDPRLLHALIVVESAYRPRALSAAGAAGLMQLMPGTASELGVVDRFDPAASIEGGAEFLARQLSRFGDLRLALAAYNAGPERVARIGRVPDIPETRAYVDQVVDCYLALAVGRRVTSSRQCAPRVR